MEHDVTDLNYDLHQVLLRYHIFAVDDLLKNTGQDGTLVHLQINTVKLTEPNEIGTDKNSEFSAFHLAFFAVS